ncbi:hemin uptake protein HemP [Reyranella sp.]|uniref:hemin uptake protein HemP n=1 Tax=Reyranella sp. TaxID=1929291 RepID=UPI003D14C9AE
MTSQIEPDGKRKSEEPSPSVLIVDSSTLLKGQRELIVRHADSRYRLRLTASNKLIMTK